MKFASVSGFTAMKHLEPELAGALLKLYNGDLLRKAIKLIRLVAAALHIYCK